MLVVKAGGAAGVTYDSICADLAGLAAAGKPWVLVHGGSAETNRVAEQLGHPPERWRVRGYRQQRHRP